jgi:hypothetical protein
VGLYRGPQSGRGEGSALPIIRFRFVFETLLFAAIRKYPCADRPEPRARNVNWEMGSMIVCPEFEFGMKSRAATVRSQTEAPLVNSLRHAETSLDTTPMQALWPRKI